MILLFSVQLGWLPASGYVSPFEDLRENLAAMIMPAFVLGNAIAAVLMRHTRSAMLQVLNADYVRTARAKGLNERVVVLKHALRNALTPIITLGALELGTLLSGAVLTEQVFTIPGFGKLIVDAVFNRDYAVVQGVVLVTATAYIAAQPAGRPGVFRGQSAAAFLNETSEQSDRDAGLRPVADVPHCLLAVAWRGPEGGIPPGLSRRRPRFQRGCAALLAARGRLRCRRGHR